MILKSNYRLLLLCRKGMFIRGGTTLQVNKFMALGFQDCPKFKAAQNSTVPLSKEDTTTPTSNSKAKAKCTANPNPKLILILRPLRRPIRSPVAMAAAAAVVSRFVFRSCVDDARPLDRRMLRSENRNALF